MEAYLKANSLAALYDSVFIPVIIATETDHRLELLDDEQRVLVEQTLRDIIEDLVQFLRANRRSTRSKRWLTKRNQVVQRRFRFIACPRGRIATHSRGDAHPVTATARRGAQNATGKLAAGELLDLVGKSDVDAACISVVSPSTVIQARYLCVKLRARFPQLKIVIGLWGMTQGVTDATAGCAIQARTRL